MTWSLASLSRWYSPPAAIFIDPEGSSHSDPCTTPSALNSCP